MGLVLLCLFSPRHFQTIGPELKSEYCIGVCLASRAKAALSSLYCSQGLVVPRSKKCRIVWTVHFRVQAAVFQLHQKWVNFTKQVIILLHQDHWRFWDRWSLRSIEIGGSLIQSGFDGIIWNSFCVHEINICRESSLLSFTVKLESFRTSCDKAASVEARGLILSEKLNQSADGGHTS